MTELILAQAPLVDKLQRVASHEQMTAEALLVQVVTDYLAQKDVQAVLDDTIAPYEPDKIYADFEQEVATFEQIKPQLLQKYPGKVVAIYQGQVVAVGEERIEVHNQVIEKYGNVPCYVENVIEDTPRVVRVTSSWKAR